jgi:hypothetical protein
LLDDDPPQDASRSVRLLTTHTASKHRIDKRFSNEITSGSCQNRASVAKKKRAVVFPRREKSSQF